MTFIIGDVETADKDPTKGICSIFFAAFDRTRFIQLADAGQLTFENVGEITSVFGHQLGNGGTDFGQILCHPSDTMIVMPGAAKTHQIPVDALYHPDNLTQYQMMTQFWPWWFSHPRSVSAGHNFDFDMRALRHAAKTSLLPPTLFTPRNGTGLHLDTLELTRIVHHLDAASFTWNRRTRANGTSYVGMRQVDIDGLPLRDAAAHNAADDVMSGTLPILVKFAHSRAVFNEVMRNTDPLHVAQRLKKNDSVAFYVGHPWNEFTGHVASVLTPSNSAAVPKAFLMFVIDGCSDEEFQANLKKLSSITLAAWKKIGHNLRIKKYNDIEKSYPFLYVMDPKSPGLCVNFFSDHGLPLASKTSLSGEDIRKRVRLLREHVNKSGLLERAAPLIREELDKVEPLRVNDPRIDQWYGVFVDKTYGDFRRGLERSFQAAPNWESAAHLCATMKWDSSEWWQQNLQDEMLLLIGEHAPKMLAERYPELSTRYIKLVKASLFRRKKDQPSLPSVIVETKKLIRDPANKAQKPLLKRYLEKFEEEQSFWRQKEPVRDRELDKPVLLLGMKT